MLQSNICAIFIKSFQIPTLFRKRSNREISREEINRWHNIVHIFFNELDQPESALAILSALGEESDFKDDSVMFTEWSKFLRKWARNLSGSAKRNKLEKASWILSKHHDEAARRRSYYTEWGVVEGSLNHYYFGVWLNVVSLADNVPDKENLANPVCMDLASLAKAFSRCYVNTENEVYKEAFKKAAIGAAKMGLDEKSIRAISFPHKDSFNNFSFKDNFDNLNESLQMVDGDVSTISLDSAFENVVYGIELAYDLCEVEKDELPVNLPKPSELTFNELKKIFGINHKASTLSEPSKLEKDERLINTSIENNKIDNILHRKEGAFWEFTFNGEIPFSVKATSGVQYIYKLLEKRNESQNPEVMIPIKELFELDRKDINKTPEQLRNNMDSIIRTAINNISEKNPSCGQFFEKIVKATVDLKIAYLIYQPTVPERKWTLK